jgi:hypothetical protein
MSITNSLKARFEAMFGRELAEIQARHDTEVKELHQRIAARDAEITRLRQLARVPIMHVGNEDACEVQYETSGGGWL